MQKGVGLADGRDRVPARQKPSTARAPHGFCRRRRRMTRAPGQGTRVSGRFCRRRDLLRPARGAAAALRQATDEHLLHVGTGCRTRLHVLEKGTKA